MAKDAATVRFRKQSEGNRSLLLRDDAAFDLSYWCGTCPFLFERVGGGTVWLEALQDRLADGFNGLDESIITAFGELLGEDDYLPLLIRLQPTLVEPLDAFDYFSHEGVATWGRNGTSGLPENPQTAYYRTFSTAVDADTHLYEFVVPMVPPSWNDKERVQQYVELMKNGREPTAVAIER